MDLTRRRIERLILGSIIALSVILTGAVALNFMLHIYNIYSDSDKLFELWLNVLAIFVNGLFSAGILLLYSRMGSAQEDQRDLMEEQRNIDENQRTIMREQTSISEDQQQLQQLQQQCHIDLEGQKPINDNSILVCVSNHGEGIATSPQLLTSVSYQGEENQEVTFNTGSFPLSKVCQGSYRNTGTMIGAKETGVELSSDVLFQRVTEDGAQNYTFPKMATELSANGVDEVNIQIKLVVVDIFRDSAEDILYRFTVAIHSNMTFEEAVQNSVQ